ncbi:MAG: hypothetical protein H6563_14010 [Lewinellaceae bacterium]|nr:hypothetical protein [Lewinellaceae bacterium]
MANTIEVYVDFIENKVPGLTSGDYTVQVTQDLQATGVQKGTSFKSIKMPFSVRGDRFSLKPTDVTSVYPPPASLGAHSNILPQIALRRNTLPWERWVTEPDKSALKNVKKIPWLALLVFNENELKSKDANASTSDIEQGSIILLKDFMSKMDIESGENDQDKIKVIYASKSLLKDLIPSSTALTHLCHVRESSLRLNLDPATAKVGDTLYYEIWDFQKTRLHHAEKLVLNPANPAGGQLQALLSPGALPPGAYSIVVKVNNNLINPQSISPQKITVSPNDEFGHQVAIVVANRLPQPGARSIVHLVSLEKRFKEENGKYVFDFGNAGEEDLIPLVTLKSWSFSCVSDTHNFDQLLTNLAEKGKGDTQNTLRLPLLPQPGNETANGYLQSGFVPLPHFFRRGGKSVSWYRGPLIPGIPKTSFLTDGLLPASCSDALLGYNDMYGMFDVSYAAAWELGRSLALRNKKFSTSLYNWKRLHQQQLLLAEQQEMHPHLPFHADTSLPAGMPADLDAWFSQISLLKGLPFNYLVPDERMLPVESIRFFSLDQDWIDCLIDGAFSVGRVTPGNASMDKILQARLSPSKTVSGFLLRSYVVAGWPTLNVEGSSNLPKEAELPMLRMERLSPSVLLCLFEGSVDKVDIYQRPEMLHLGFGPNPTKNLRNAQGSDDKPPEIAPELLGNRVVDVETLFSKIQGESFTLGFVRFTAAQFALSMLDGAQKVRIVRG